MRIVVMEALAPIGSMTFERQEQNSGARAVSCRNGYEV